MRILFEDGAVCKTQKGILKLEGLMEMNKKERNERILSVIDKFKKIKAGQKEFILDLKKIHDFDIRMSVREDFRKLNEKDKEELIKRLQKMYGRNK